MEDIRHDRWKGKTGGTPWMQRSLIWLFSWLDLRVMYSLMGFTILFYMLFNHKGYMSMYHFFRRRFGYSPLKSFLNVYANHFRFGQVILDRFASYAGKKFDMEIDGYEHFAQLDQADDGFEQLSSHIGNYELAGYSLKSEHKNFNALVFSGETETMMEGRNKMLGKNNIRMISVQEDMSHIFTLNNALRDGEIVSMPADRIFGSTKYAECMFMGEIARFPLGPFALAVQREVKVIAVFVMKESVNKYKIYIRNIQTAPDSTAVGKQKMKELAQCFASEMEKIIRKYPTQWFNYFDFWEK
ncbi:MAG TPA: acyltransferase [Xylanibacter oryzae]|nr:acyltransferase [Xylanibacter oryzae]